MSVPIKVAVVDDHTITREGIKELLNQDFSTLERVATPVPPRIPAAGTEIVPFHAGEVLDWRFVA